MKILSELATLSLARIYEESKLKLINTNIKRFVTEKFILK